MTTLDGGLYGLSMFLSIQFQRLHFFGGVSERTVERYISKFPVTGDVKSKKIGRSYEETRNVFQLKKKKREILSSSESRTFRQTFIVGVLIIFTQEERNLYVWNFVYQIA